MPTQHFAPMTKDFPTFDCDAHVTEPPWIWKQAADWLTKDEMAASPPSGRSSRRAIPRSIRVRN